VAFGDVMTGEAAMAYAVIGETEDHAKQREQVVLNDLVHPMASLTLLSEMMNYDFAKHDLDDPITLRDHPGLQRPACAPVGA
jgi:hypothetical protein